MTRSATDRTKPLLTVAGALVFALFMVLTWRAPAAQAQSAPEVNQCNGTDNAGGQAVICDVTVINHLNRATGATRSTVIVRECHGAANAPPTCTTSTTPSNELTTAVTQCNGSGSGGGGEVNCNVLVVNNVTGTATRTPATVNQCNGSGTGGGTQPTTVCTPLGNTTGATVTQCNGSGNGGGGTMRVRCTVFPSTRTSALPVTVNQCNGSGNGGGATVTCTTRLTNNIFAVAPPVVGPPGSAPPPTDLPRTGSTATQLVLPAIVALVLGGLLVLLSGPLPGTWRGARRRPLRR